MSERVSGRYKEKDEELFRFVERLKQGETEIYEDVYKLSERYIYKIINDIIKNHHTTEDLMQNTYIKIYNNIKKLENVKSFNIWAGRIATNETLSYLRKQKNSEQVFYREEEEQEYFFENVKNDTEEFIPEDILINKEKQKIIADIIDGLSKEQKVTVQFYYYEEMSITEIADIMECSTGTVKSRLNYARKSIKEAILNMEKKDGVKLYSLASLPLLWLLFREEVLQMNQNIKSTIDNDNNVDDTLKSMCY